ERYHNPSAAWRKEWRCRRGRYPQESGFRSVAWRNILCSDVVPLIPLQLLQRYRRESAGCPGASSNGREDNPAAHGHGRGGSVSFAAIRHRAQNQRAGEGFLRQARQSRSEGSAVSGFGESRSGCSRAGKPGSLQPGGSDLCHHHLSPVAGGNIYNSRQELFQQGAIPRKELDQAGVDLTQARNQYQIAQKHLDALMATGKQQALKSAAGQLESAKGKFLGAAAQMSYSQIRSPIDGVVTDRPLYPGEMAAAGTPIVTVMDISQVIAKAHIPQPEAALLKVGDKATITVPGESEPVDAKVTVVSPALDPNSTTVEVWVQAKNPKQRLKPGTSVQVSMVAQTIPDALVIPAAALLTGQDGTTTVMVVGADNRAHQKPVSVGIRQGDQVQITEGLQAGDHVVASGAYGLPDNTQVTVAAQTDEKQNEKQDEKQNEK
ncbi:MAG: hypothetical protein DMG84_03920, partial [Acidobacteria bacterium]